MKVFSKHRIIQLVVLSSTKQSLFLSKFFLTSSRLQICTYAQPRSSTCSILQDHFTNVCVSHAAKICSADFLTVVVPTEPKERRGAMLVPTALVCSHVVMWNCVIINKFFFFFFFKRSTANSKLCKYVLERSCSKDICLYTNTNITYFFYKFLLYDEKTM